MPASPVPNGRTDDLSFEMFHDPLTAKWIRAAERAKERAILDENFGLAKSLKGLMQVLKHTGEELAKMETTKKKAVLEENFDAAAAAKRDIDQLRQALLQKISQDGFAIDSAGEIVLQTIIMPAEMPLSSTTSTSEQHTSTTRSERLLAPLHHKPNPSVDEIRSHSPKQPHDAIVSSDAIISHPTVHSDSTAASSEPTSVELTVPAISVEAATTKMQRPPSPESSPPAQTSPSPKEKSAMKSWKKPFARKRTETETSAVSAKSHVSESPPKEVDRPIAPTKEHLPAKENSPTKERAPIKENAPAKDPPSPKKGKAPAAEKPTKPAIYDEDRPIVVKKKTFNVEEFDENSVPPGLAPSRNMKPGTKSVFRKKAVATKEEEHEELPPSPTKSPMVRKQAKVTKTVPTKKDAEAEAPPAPPVEKEWTVQTRNNLDPDHPFNKHQTSNFEVEEMPNLYKTELSDAIQLFGEHLICCLASKQFAAREWALSEVTRIVTEVTELRQQGRDGEEPGVVVRGVYGIIGKAIADPREKVITLALQIWRALLGTFLYTYDSSQSMS